ncbi:hypothetical protein CORC01_00769 [Colletotrichum orchidophilum]|uniref:Extracellular membrane protein CFEM domain-containing protein n=1 Tax=Colletotrichum orchidophilum TaxID=1209926 RepID=A0A1G4BRK3_9PEZI|nr:uncharacterized protein CORC01_00769 [Colletotrichum orchidophilum]OHF03907.1 hypothetical protein CORC01_00769 [Colletotrichum orchidophilum]
MNKIVFVLAMASAAAAAPLNARQDVCEDAYNACVDAGTAEVACSCTLTACLGEDNARNREYCASATANLTQPTPTGIPGGCNPAHPGSCPSSYFTYTTAFAAATASVTVTANPAPVFTSIPGIPGGCNPAHPGSCPSNYFTYPTAVPTPTPTPTPGSGGTPPVYPNPTPVDHKTWTIKDLIRYCGVQNDGCDYNFAIETDDETERCTIIREPGSNAATESWSDQPCTSGSNFTVSCGYVAEPGPAFAVITVVYGKEIAWFGVPDINGKPVTTAPSSPFGSGQFGDLGPEQVYTY